MKLGINEAILKPYYSFDETISLLKEIGFNAIDFSFYVRNEEFENDDWQTVAENYLKITDKYNIKISQMHANWFKNEDDEKIKAYKIKMNKRALAVAEILNCPYVVFHATKFQGYYRDVMIQKRANQYNINLFQEYEKHLPPNVKIALENMFGYETDTIIPAETIFSRADQINQYIKLLNNNFVACLDTGHAFIARQNIAEMILELNNLLKVLHLSDAILSLDTHLAPNLGEVDWDKFAMAIASSNFNGVLSLELNEFKNGVGIIEYIKYAYLQLDEIKRKINILRL